MGIHDSNREFQTARADPDPHVRAAAYRRLAEDGKAFPEFWIQYAVADASEIVRLTAADLLPRLNLPLGHRIHWLLGLCKDSYPDVRARSVAGLAALQAWSHDTQVMPILCDMIQKEDPAGPVHPQVVQALTAVGIAVAAKPVEPPPAVAPPADPPPEPDPGPGGRFDGGIYGFLLSVACDSRVPRDVREGASKLLPHDIPPDVPGL